MKKPNKIAVLMGGSGEERKVSLKSGKAIAKALRENGYNVMDLEFYTEFIVWLISCLVLI